MTRQSSAVIKKQGAYHGFIIKRKALHGSQSIGGTVNLFEDHKGLTLHFKRPGNEDVQDLAKL